MTEFTFTVHKDPNTIKQYLTNAEKFVAVHPLIYKITALGENKFKVFEGVKIGIIPCHFTYKAVFTHLNNSPKIDVAVMGLAKISMEFSFQAHDQVTVVNERLTVKSLLPIRNFMYKLIKAQHQIMFNNIEAI